MTEPAHATPTAHVPSDAEATGQAVERYCAELLLALRLQEMPGERIGAFLAEVRDHLSNSDEDPVEAFGTPQEYADALTAGRPAPSRTARALEMARHAAGVAGLLWAIEGGTALLSGDPAVLTEFQVVLPVLIALAAPALLDAVVRARRSAVLGWGALVTVVVTAVVVVHAWAGPLLSVTLPPAALLVPGLVVTAAWIAVTAHTVDPVIGPLQDAASVHRRRRRDSTSFAVLMLLLLIVPVVVLVTLRHLG